jgi:hypothetical protein
MMVLYEATCTLATSCKARLGAPLQLHERRSGMSQFGIYVQSIC